jgi:Protein of unknown function (DUF3176)
MAKPTSRQQHYNQQPQRTRWQSLQMIPWFAFLSILTCSACIAASIGIVVGSNKKPVLTWKIKIAPPAVLLAIVSSIVSITLGFILATGIAITWWRSALYGTTLAGLHYIYNHGSARHFWPAISNSFETRKAAFLAIMIAASRFLNGPLLQQASETNNLIVSESIVMNLDIPLQLPDGWFGTREDAPSLGEVTGSPGGLRNLQQWYINRTLTTDDNGGFFCNGTCIGKVPGAGIQFFNCSTSESSINLLDEHNYLSSDKTVLFDLGLQMDYSQTPPSLVYSTKFVSSNENNCLARITAETCYIQAAIVEYSINIQDTTLWLDHDTESPYQLLNEPIFISNYTSLGDSPPQLQPLTPAGTLTGLEHFMGTYLRANAWQSSPNVYSGVNIANLFYDYDPAHYSNYTLNNCNLLWFRPTNYVKSALINFMFRAALDAGASKLSSIENATQTFPGRRLAPTLVYHSNYRYLVASVIVTIVGLLAAMLLLWGWWELGRPVTLSPLETANAFSAPILLQETEHKREVGEIVASAGDVNVRYDGQALILGREVM